MEGFSGPLPRVEAKHGWCRRFKNRGSRPSIVYLFYISLILSMNSTLKLTSKSSSS